MGTRRHGHAVGAGAVDRPRPCQQRRTLTHAGAIGEDIEGVATARPGVVAEYAAQPGGRGRRIPGTGAVPLQLRAARCDLAELGLGARPQPVGTYDRTGIEHLRTAPERDSSGREAQRNDEVATPTSKLAPPG